MSNRRRGVYDPGACDGGATEAALAMEWANELRGILKAQGHAVIRTRVDAKDPAPVSRRDDIAVSYGGDVMLSIHCNSGGGQASGCEVFYRGADDKAKAEKLSSALSAALGIKNRGAKTEQESQHTSLAVMEFDKCWLVEIGFIDNAGDRAKMLDPKLRKVGCEALASALVS